MSFGKLIFYTYPYYMKGPFEVLTNTMFENLTIQRENQRFNFNYLDNFMIWIVGFAIGGLSIIAANLTALNKLLDHHVIKIILILLTVSIVSGIIYRWSFYLYQVYYQNFEFYLRGAFSNKEMMEIDPEEIKDEKDIKEVVRRLKTDFGEDASFILDTYKSLNTEGKEMLLADFKNHYQRIAKSVKEEYILALAYTKDTFVKGFGISEKRYDQAFTQNSAPYLKFYRTLSGVAYVLSTISFIIVILILVCNY